MTRPQDDERTSEALRRALARLPQGDLDQDFQDLEVFAELREQTRTLADVPGDVLERLVDQVGPAEVLEALRGEAAAPSERRGWLLPFRPWALLAAAAVVALAVVLAWPSTGAGPRAEHLAFVWPPTDPFADSKVDRVEDPHRGPGTREPDFGIRLRGGGPWSAMRAAPVVLCGEAVGTGIRFHRDFVLTAGHVVEAEVAAAVLAGRTPRLSLAFLPLDPAAKPVQVAARVWKRDRARDLVLLRLADAAGLPAELLQWSEREPDAADTVAVGSVAGDAPWRSFPARVLGPARPSTAVEPHPPDWSSLRCKVFPSDLELHPGMTGGPLLDADGKVLGLTFAAAVDRSTGAWHVAAGELREFVADLPADAAELVPQLDHGWLGPRGRLEVLRREIKGPPEGLEALVFRYLDAAGAAEGYSVFVRPRSGAPGLSPRGLPGAEERGDFAFEVAVLGRRDGTLVLARTDATGVVDLIGCRTPGNGVARVWRRRAGSWQVATVQDLEGAMAAAFPANGFELLTAAMRAMHGR